MGSALVGGRAPGERGMHNHLAHRDQLKRPEQPLAADVLAQETAGARLQRTDDVLGGLRRRQDDSLNAGIGPDDLAHQCIRDCDGGLDTRQPDATSLRAQIRLQLLVERDGDACRPKSGFAEELTEPIMEQGRRVRHNNGKTHNAYSYWTFLFSPRVSPSESASVNGADRRLVSICTSFDANAC